MHSTSKAAGVVMAAGALVSMVVLTSCGSQHSDVRVRVWDEGRQRYLALSHGVASRDLEFLEFSYATGTIRDGWGPAFKLTPGQYRLLVYGIPCGPAQHQLDEAILHPFVVVEGDSLDLTLSLNSDTLTMARGPDNWKQLSCAELALLNGVSPIVKPLFARGDSVQLTIRRDGWTGSWLGHVFWTGRCVRIVHSQIVQGPIASYGAYTLDDIELTRYWSDGEPETITAETLNEHRIVCVRTHPTSEIYSYLYDPSPRLSH